MILDSAQFHRLLVCGGADDKYKVEVMAMMTSKIMITMVKMMMIIREHLHKG